MANTDSRIYFEIVFAAGTSKLTPVASRRFVWRIKREGNHEILVSSEVLNAHQTCVDAINLVYQDASKTKLVDTTK